MSGAGVDRVRARWFRVLIRASLSARRDHIELSDDEEVSGAALGRGQGLSDRVYDAAFGQDMHPNIDRDSMVRLKRRAREDREAKEEAEQKAFEKKVDDGKKQVDLLTKKLADLSSKEESEDIKVAKQSLGKQLEKMKKESDAAQAAMAKMAKEKKWNVGNLCHVVEDRTIVPSGKAENSSAAQGPAQELGYEQFIKSYGGLIDMYGKLNTNSESRDFLARHMDLLNEHTTGHLLLACLDAEMNGQRSVRV